MKIRIISKVDAPLSKVKSGFTADLFLALNPPFPPVILLQFDGCQRGDKVALELNFLLFKQTWISEITEEGETQNEWFFVDIGRKLPFFLKRWKHRHIVATESAGSKIIDEITYSTGTLVSDVLLYPALVAQFWYRKPIYKKRFAH